MPKENIKISNILVKEEKTEVLSKVKEEILGCPIKERKKPKSYKTKGNIVL
jgi:hypothetical protein